jgi:hypothetical protein
LTAAPTDPPAGGDYIFLPNKIASPADKGKYTKYGYTNLSAILPPTNWRYRYPGGVYSDAFPPPDISTDEHFQVWMRTAGWSTFLKTYGRGTEVLPKGNYQMTIDMSKCLGLGDICGGCIDYPFMVTAFFINNTLFLCTAFVLDFPIDTYGGKKFIVISSIGATGGRNNFLGIGYIVVAIICAALGVVFTAFHIARPR